MRDSLSSFQAEIANDKQDLVLEVSFNRIVWTMRKECEIFWFNRIINECDSLISFQITILLFVILL